MGRNKENKENVGRDNHLGHQPRAWCYPGTQGSKEELLCCVIPNDLTRELFGMEMSTKTQVSRTEKKIQSLYYTATTLCTGAIK